MLKTMVWMIASVAMLGLTACQATPSGDKNLNTSAECCGGAMCEGKKDGSCECCEMCRHDEQMTCATCPMCKDGVCMKKGDKATAAPASVAPQASGDKAVIQAKGMSCPLCASNADRRLKKVPGVTGVNIDLGTGQIVVALDENQPAPQAQELEQAVRDAGFTPESVTMPGS